MKKFLEFWPVSKEAKKDVMHLIVSIVLYCVASWLVSIILGRFGFLFGIIVYVFELYCTAGIVFSFLYFFKVFK